METGNSFYKVKYISCRVCGADDFKLLGIRGNLEYLGAKPLEDGTPHMITNVVRCNRCNFVYTNPYIITDERDNFYNDVEDYKPSSCGKGEGLFKNTLSILEKFSKGGRLLDIGSGKGEFLNLARESGWEVYGVEVSCSLRGYSENKYSLKIERRALGEARYPDGYFDAVVLNMVLEHLEEPNNVMKEVYRILNDRGVVLIEVPNMDSLLLRLISLFYMLKRKNWSPYLSPLHKPYHSFGYSNSTLRFLLEKHNLFIVKTINTSLLERGIEERETVSPLLRTAALAVTAIGAIFGMADVSIVIARKNR